MLQPARRAMLFSDEKVRAFCEELSVSLDRHVRPKIDERAWNTLMSDIDFARIMYLGEDSSYHVD